MDTSLSFKRTYAPELLTDKDIDDLSLQAANKDGAKHYNKHVHERTKRILLHDRENGLNRVKKRKREENVEQLLTEIRDILEDVLDPKVAAVRKRLRGLSL